MSEQQKELNVLTNQEDIAKVKRLINRVAFSIYFRRKNVEQHQHELKAVEKIQRFLANESNENYRTTSKLWISMGQTVQQHIDQINKVVEEAKVKDVSEIAFLEQLREHVTINPDTKKEQYDANYFTAIFPYASVNGDTDEFDPMLKAMMRESGFLPSYNPNEPKEATAEPIDEPIENVNDNTDDVKNEKE